jgi:hypothetical protein
MLKHFQPERAPPTVKELSSHTSSHAVQAIIIDCESVVNPELAAIIRRDRQPVGTTPFDDHGATPTNSEMISSEETWPSARSGSVVHPTDSTSRPCTAATQIRAASTLTEIEDFFPNAHTANGLWSSHSCIRYNGHSVTGVATPVSEYHACPTATFKHF